MLRFHDEPVRTQYAEIKERARAAGHLLPGTPGSLVTRRVKGTDYLYRAHYAVSGHRVDDYLGVASNVALRKAAMHEIAFADWMQTRVGQLRKLGFQVADKHTARILVELHNRQMFEAGLVLVGTLAYMAWLNEFGVLETASRTSDVDVARGQLLKLAAPVEFLAALKATELPFVPVPGLPSSAPSTSIKLPGVEGLRVDVLAPGVRLGAPVRIPELAWHAQAVPHFDYLLERAEPAAILAGGHCVPVRLPQAGRFVWHKLYSSRRRRGEPEKAAKDRSQALTLILAMARDPLDELRSSFRAAPPALRSALSPLLSGLARDLRESSAEAHDLVMQLRPA
jgi:hypothetical protein